MRCGEPPFMPIVFERRGVEELTEETRRDGGRAMGTSGVRVRLCSVRRSTEDCLSP